MNSFPLIGNNTIIVMFRHERGNRMAIYYYCRHCQVQVGTIEQSIISASELGFDHLTGEERKEMIDYDGNGNVYVKVICEDCQEALERNPDLHQYENIIQ